MICMTLESKVEGLSIKRVVAHAVMPEMVLSEVSGTTGTVERVLSIRKGSSTVDPVIRTMSMSMIVLPQSDLRRG